MYYKELTHRIMEAEKSRDLLFLSWRPRRASGIVQSKFEGLKSKRADGV